VAAQSIRVGAVLPVTGVFAAFGTPYAEAIKMAIEEANSGGGINGRQIEFTVEDSQASNTVAINALNRVLQSNPIAIFGPALGTQTLAMMPITEREKIPLIAGPSTRRVTQQGANYFFRNASHDAIDKENWTRFLVDGLGKKKIGILHTANEWGYSGRDNTATFLEKLYGLKPASIASYQSTDKDMTAQILQMTRDGVDAIVVQGHPVDETILIKQMRQLGVLVPTIGSASLCIAYLRDLVSTAEVSGRYCEAPDVMPSMSDRPRVKAFVQAYKKRTGFPPDIYTMFYYDGAGMLIAVMKKYGVDREKIRQGFREMTYDGGVGSFKVDEEGNLWHDAVVMQFQPDGSGKVVRRHSEKP
jgi:branched-chain amino acid transport system substrate-binding protein